MKKHEEQIYNDGHVIFREGDKADCMYRVEYGIVNIYINYKTDRQKLLTTLQADDFFGEMALVDSTVRSATAVAKFDGTRLLVYPKEELSVMVREDAPVFMDLMDQMVSNLVHLTDRYADVCRTIAEYRKCDEDGTAIGEQLSESIDRYAGMVEDRGLREV